ncbi:hypothetical protein KSF73_00740 [Burkholderiaceae bacterium DAT-1]|nr:hypothetical protein [Burkholderiaceae bacterium DAT-1]
MKVQGTHYSERSSFNRYLNGIESVLVESYDSLNILITFRELIVRNSYVAILLFLSAVGVSAEGVSPAATSVVCQAPAMITPKATTAERKVFNEGVTAYTACMKDALATQRKLAEEAQAKGQSLIAEYQAFSKLLDSFKEEDAKANQKK